MALLQCNFFAPSLMRTVPVQVILPTDRPIQDSSLKDRTLKTLYLLHGLTGNYTDWVSGTRILAWAQEQNLAVVMPSGDNQFYVDKDIPGERYGSFIRRDLVEFTRRSFPLSGRREDTFIGGLSMGGYGATVCGLQAPETFGAICAFSAAYILGLAVEHEENSQDILTSRAFHERVLGPLDTIHGSERDYNALAEGLAASHGPMPRVYLACGTEDTLLETNRAFRDKLCGLGFDLTYEEGPGGHDWVFWDTYLQKALAWLSRDGGAMV